MLSCLMTYLHDFMGIHSAMPCTLQFFCLGMMFFFNWNRSLLALTKIINKLRYIDGVWY